MNAFTKLSLPLALAMTLNLRGATNDVSTFTGTVVDPDGNPVAGAAVDFYQYPSRTSPGPMEMEPQQHATTDGQGAFVLSNFDGQGVAVVTKTGVTPGWRTWYAVPEEPQKIALTAPSSLAGVVVDDAGRPVADAEVWVSVALSKTLTDYGEPSSLFGKIARDLFSAKTSADGKFRIENFPAGAQAVLSVKKSGMTLHQTSSPLRSDELPFHAGQEHITLTLNPAASVSGRVIVRGTGQPLAGAFVGLQPMVPGVRVLTLNMGTVVSTTDGSFQIHDVPAGSFQIMALWTNQPIADWVAEPVPLEVAAGQAVSGVQLQAYKGGVAEVTVLGKTKHEPIADASVSMSSGDFNGSGSTGTNGVVYFRLPPGQYTAFASKQDWSQAQMQTTVTEGRTTQATLELAAPSEVSGIVRDDSGAPVAGANVGVFPNYSGTGSGARTDANGRYELRWQKPSWAGSANQSFYLLARDSERKLAAVQEMDETTTNLDVTLKPAMNLSGSVQDTKGRAVTNAMAYIMLHMENMGFTITRQRIFSDEQGRIHAEALPKGERYELYVSAQGYGNARQEMQAADPKADHYDFPPLILKIADRKLAGRVLGTNGTPVADAQVWLNGEGQPNGNATTDARGWFHYDAVCEGALTVSANFKGLSGSAEAMGGDTNVVIRFSTQNRVYMASTPQTLTGTVFDSSGNAAAGVRVIVTPSIGAEDVGKADANGEFSVNWQPQPGMRDAKYYAVARDLEKNLAAIEAIDPKQKSVTLRLELGLSLSGTVQDAKGAPLTRAHINLNMMAGNMGGLVEYAPIKLNSDGTFTIPALPMGQRYLVFARADGYGSERRNVSEIQSRTNHVQLTAFKLKTADRQLAGQVLGADGKPLSGVQVMINGNGQPNGNARTDSTGHFKFKVCDGPIQVYAFAPSGPGPIGNANSGSTYARGGDTDVVVKMGARQQPKAISREVPLKPQPWTLGAIAAWPGEHKTGTIILLSLQVVVVMGTVGGIFWFTRKRG